MLEVGSGTALEVESWTALEVESGTAADWRTGRWYLKKPCRLAIHQVSSYSY